MSKKLINERIHQNLKTESISNVKNPISFTSPFVYHSERTASYLPPVYYQNTILTKPQVRNIKFGKKPLPSTGPEESNPNDLEDNDAFDFLNEDYCTGRINQLEGMVDPSVYSRKVNSALMTGLIDAQIAYDDPRSSNHVLGELLDNWAMQNEFRINLLNDIILDSADQVAFKFLFNPLIICIVAYGADFTCGSIILNRTTTDRSSITKFVECNHNLCYWA